MTKPTIRVFVTLLAALTLAPFASTFAASGNSSDVLKYIPADSPYVIASTEAMPDALADKLEPSVDEMLASYRKIVRYAMDEGLSGAGDSEKSEEEIDAAQSLAEELLSLMSIDGIRAAGIQRDSAFAFYGHGLLPVFRFELSEEELFDKTIARFEDSAGEKMSVGTAKGESYQYIDFDGRYLLLATIDDQVVITIVPSDFDEAQVATALGIDLPRTSLKKTRALAKIAKEYGYSDYLVGFVDNIQLAKTFSGEVKGLDADLFALADSEMPEWSDTCKAELMQLVGAAPRMVFGYTDLSATTLDSSFVVELRDDIASGLATVPAAVPGLGIDPGGFMSIGFGLNPIKARDFVEARVTAMEEDPLVCDRFAPMQEGVAQMRAGLSQPLPPMLYGFRGFVANIMDMDTIDISKEQPPENVDATVLLAMENAQSLLMMGAMMDPQLAALDLQPDGKPVKLDFPQLADIADDVYAAMSEDALSLSFGEGAEDNSAAALFENGTEPAPFMSFSMDAARYYKMIGDAMMRETPDEEGKEMPLEVRQALQHVMLLSGSMYERASANVMFTKRGIEMSGTMTLAD